MHFKEKFIKYTGREYLIYKIVDQVFFLFSKYLNLIKNGHFVRSYRIREYLNDNKIRKLHLGCGGNYFCGFLNSDIFGEIPIDVTNRLPFFDASFDLIYSNHILEHVYKIEFKRYLSESYRVLKKGGFQIICVPSIEKISKIMYFDNDDNASFIKREHLRLYSLENEVHGASYINDVMHIFFGHKYLYDFDTIKFLASNVGYSNVQKIGNYDISDEIIRENINKKGRFWDLTSETFILIK